MMSNLTDRYVRAVLRGVPAPMPWGDGRLL
jgi:hypothetical protein